MGGGGGGGGGGYSTVTEGRDRVGQGRSRTST